MNLVKYHNQEYTLEFDEYHTPFLLSLWASNTFAEEYKRLTGVDVGTFFMIRNDHNVGYMQSDASMRIYQSNKKQNEQKLD